MSLSSPPGRYVLKSGVRLVADAGGGVLWQDAPLRALRLNRAAFSILEQCREGLSLGGEDPRRAASVHPFLDGLWRKGLVDWEPDEGGELPRVSVVVPVYDRAREIGPCLESLMKLDYGPPRPEIVVVDDGSRDGTKDVVRGYDVRLVELPSNGGQSAARNVGARVASGDVLAFIDSDCLADPRWLRDLAPWFQDPRVVLVGGYVASHYRRSLLDRYDQVRSPLNMGDALAMGCTGDSDFYVPTCNMLVRRQEYLAAGGLNESIRVGEDVDLCWRLKKDGRILLYIPRGRVEHKHRGRFFENFKRRFDYGTSEAFLFSRHPQVRKRFPRRWASLAFLGLCAAGLVAGPLPCFLSAAGVWLGESFVRRRRMEKAIGSPAGPLRRFLAATLRDHALLAYYLAYHVTRYYLLLLALLAFLAPATWLLATVVALSPPAADYLRKRPRLIFPVYLFFYLAEQVSYQAGVFRGCVKRRGFQPYHLFFRSSSR